MDAAAFQLVWDSFGFAGPFIKAARIDNRRGGLRFFRLGDEYAVVSDTRRKTRGDNRPVYEIVWASSVLGVSAATGDGLLFTTMDMTGRQGWRSAGYHAHSIYNYRPPAYGMCDILMLREEL
jgi:hypothetical protein